jgi:hypothetical protein
MHFGVTAAPTEQWTAQQLRDATPWTPLSPPAGRSVRSLLSELR